MRVPSWKSIIVIVAAGAAFYLVMAILTDIDKIAQAFKEFSWLFFAPVLVLVAFNYLIRAERWHIFLARVGLGLPRGRSYRIFLSGLSMSATPGKVGEALKAVLLRTERGAAIERGIGIVFVERLSDLTGMLVLIGIGIFALPYGVLSFIVMFVVVAGIIALVTSRRLSGKLISWLKGRKRLNVIGNALEAPLRDSSELLSGRSLLQGTVYSTMGWAAECLAFFVILAGSSAGVGLIQSVFIYAFSSVIGAISMLPGGMGTTEATMVGMLLLQGTAAYVASFAVILTRVATLWFAVAVGVVFLAMYSKRSQAIDEPAQSTGVLESPGEGEK